MASKRDTMRTQLLSNAAANYARLSQPLEQKKEASSLVNRTAKNILPLVVYENTDGTVIQLPSELRLNDLTAWNDALWREKNASLINFDFSATKFYTPLNLLFIPHQIREFHKQHPEVRLHATNYQHLSYPAHMGFFSCFGGAYGKTVGEASGDRNYLPISIINVSQFIRENGVGNIRDAIDSETKRLARVLVRSESGFAFDVVSTACVR